MSETKAAQGFLGQSSDWHKNISARASATRGYIRLPRIKQRSSSFIFSLLYETKTGAKNISSQLLCNVIVLLGVAIAKAMLKPGELILADEPTGSLDARMAATVMDSLVAAAHGTGKTLVVVTHDMAMAQKCDRELRMDRGRLV